MMKKARKLRHLVMLPVCALLFFIGAVTVQAATYYVATTGNDAHTCATAQAITAPKNTIASGVACLNPGDTLYIRAGTYTETLNVGAKTGNASNYITIAAYPGESAVIAPSNGARAIVGTSSTSAYWIFDGMTWDGVNHTVGTNGNIIASGSHHIILRNLEIKNWHYHGLYIEGNDIAVRNNKIHDQVSSTCVPGTRYYGIYFQHGNDGVIAGNDIYNNPGGGLQAYPGTITNLIIQKNKLHDNNACTTSPEGGVVVSEGSGVSISGVQISNNLIYNNGSAPSHGDSPGIRVANTVSNTTILNNTIYGNDGWGINIQTSTVSGTVVKNNIVFANTAGQISNVGTGTTLSNNLTTDPSFVNAAAFDFNLQTSSRAIDNGVTLSQVTTDFKGTLRPKGMAYDIGAYEVGTGSDIDEAPIAPIGLKIN